jgi:hypothetical protein
MSGELLNPNPVLLDTGSAAGLASASVLATLGFEVGGAKGGAKGAATERGAEWRAALALLERRLVRGRLPQRAIRSQLMRYLRCCGT